MSTRVIDQEREPPESGHDRQEEGVEEEASPTEEELWIEQLEALQLRAPHEGTTLSPLNPRTQIQTIIEEDLQLGAGDFGIWSRLDDETYTGRHLIIRRPEEGNWVTFQAVPSNRSIHLLLPIHEGEPSLPNTALEDIENSKLRTNSCSGTSTREIETNNLLVKEESTTDRNGSFIDHSFEETNKPITPLTPPAPPPPPPPPPT